MNPLACFVIVTASLFATTARGGELTGKVTRVDGNRVVITLDGNELPEIGDAVTIGFSIGGTEVVDIDGQWRVISVDGARVSAELNGTASGTPARGHLARIASTARAPGPKTPRAIPISPIQPNLEDPSALDEMFARARALVQADEKSRDDRTAVRLLRQLAERGHAGGAVWYGWLLEGGRCGLKPDRAEAERWYRKAADAGDGEGAFFLANLILSSGDASKNSEAVRWYHVAADRADAAAMRQLGWMHQNGIVFPVDMKAAASWYEQSASLGFAEAHNDLGHLYLNGLGVFVDDKKAAEHLRIAAESGHVSAMVTYGWIHENGRGVPQNDAEAVRWYRAAAERGDPTGQCNLAAMLELGRGVVPSRDEAISWYRAAARQGFARAKAELARLGAGE